MHYYKFQLWINYPAQRELLSLIFSGRNSIMFIVLVRCLRLLENNALILYADPIFVVHFPIVREKQSPWISAGRGPQEQNPAPCWLFFWVFLIFHVSEDHCILCCWSSQNQRRRLQCIMEKVVLNQMHRHLLVSWYRHVMQGVNEDSTLIRSLNFNEARSA